jgi:hypoxanthine phosphoribosyltransferase
VLTGGLLVLSVAASAVTIYLFAEELQNRRRFGWKHVEKLVEGLLDDMRTRDYSPDLVLGVGRGGAILAGMLAGNLGHLPLAVVDTILDRSAGISRATIRFPECCPDLRDKDVLIVVGELYSGEDLRRGIEFAERQNPRAIKTATLLTHPAASIRPDFVGLETAKPLSAPWRISEHYKLKRL